MGNSKELTICSMATVTHDAMKNQMATYRCLARRVRMVPNMFIPKTTQITVIRISNGHSNSAYSLAVVIPHSNVIAASTIMDCHPQKWIFPNFLLHIGVFSKRGNE